MSAEVQPQDDPNKAPVVKINFTEEFANDVLNEQAKRIEKLSKQEAYPLDVDGKNKIFKRRKIRTAERAKIQALRNKLAVARLAQHSQIEEELYIAMAGYYLIDAETNVPMTKEQYLLTSYEDMRDVLEACSFRTEKPIPPPLETTR